jgi:histidinol-phosphate aminotransferase
MNIAFRQNLVSLKPYPPGKPIEEVQREYGLTRIMKLASNENPLGPSPKALAAMRRALRQVNRYPDGNVYLLRKALNERLNLPDEHFIFGCGSDDLVLLIGLTFLEPQDNIIVSDNAFIRYEMAAQVAGAQTKRVPMKDWRHDTVAMSRSVDAQTKAIFFASPNNPVGCMVTRSELEALLLAVPERVLIVIDEAYREYVQHPDYPDPLAYLQKHPNVLILRTFSKAYGLAGLRIGYGIGHPWVLDKINRIRPPFNVNLVAQAAAVAALDDHEHVRKSVALNESGRDYLHRELERLGMFCVPGYANFVLLDCGFPSDKVFEQLLRHGVIVRPMAGFGLATFLRVTIGKPAENRAFLRAFKKVLREMKKEVSRA